MATLASRLIATLMLLAPAAAGAAPWNQQEAVRTAKALSSRIARATEVGAFVGDAGKAADLQAQVNEFVFAVSLLAAELENGKTRDTTLYTYQWVVEAGQRILLDSQALGISLPEHETQAYENLMRELMSAYRKKEAR